MDYLDFGSDSSDSDHEDGDGGRMLYEMDSDEEERQENKRLLDILSIQDPPTKNQRCIQDFEAEMEAELDRRALEIESQGGMEHQKSLSRSSSTTSLNKSPRASPVPGSSAGGGFIKKSNLKRVHSTESCSGKKSVKFDIPEKSAAASLSTSEEMVVSTEEDKSASESSKAKYDELYFDSDESDGEDENKKETKESRRRFMTDDELFYDPASDEQDQLWIDNQRRRSYGESGGAQPPPPGTQKSSQASSSSGGLQQQQQTTPNNSSSKSNVSLPCTDAVLNCPACFTTLCHDCQRHELYVGQYRAMFVMNCVINKQEILKVPEKVPKKFRKLCKKATTTNQFTSNGSSDVFHPVLCKVCKTQIAMYDSEEVFHFFNVLASQP